MFGSRTHSLQMRGHEGQQWNCNVLIWHGTGSSLNGSSNASVRVCQCVVCAQMSALLSCHALQMCAESTRFVFDLRVFRLWIFCTLAQTKSFLTKKTLAERSFRDRDFFEWFKTR